MTTQPLPQSEQLLHQSLWQKLCRTFILWGILAPPEETNSSDKEQKVRQHVFLQFRRHPGGR